jgi:hypothetical protein
VREAAAGADANGERDVGVVRQLRRLLDEVRAEAALLEAHFDAWRAASTAVREESLSFTLEIGDVLLRRLDEEIALELDDIPEKQRLLSKAFGIVVVTGGDPHKATPGEEAIADDPQTGVYFREPRPITLAVYKTEDNVSTTPRTFRRQSRKKVWIVNEDSPVGFVRFNSGMFGKNSATIETDETGVVKKVGTTTTSSAAEIARAVSAAGSQAKETVDQVSAISESLGKLRQQGASAHLDDLNRQKATLEAEIAYKGVLVGAEEIQELAELKRAAERMATLKTLGADADAVRIADTSQTLRDTIEVAKLQIELEKLRAELATRA